MSVRPSLAGRTARCIGRPFRRRPACWAKSPLHPCTLSPGGARGFGSLSRLRVGVRVGDETVNKSSFRSQNINCIRMPEDSHRYCLLSGLGCRCCSDSPPKSRGPFASGSTGWQCRSRRRLPSARGDRAFGRRRRAPFIHENHELIEFDIQLKPACV